MRKLLVLFIALFIAGRCQAQVSVTQNTLIYFQDFNTLDSITTSSSRTALPPGWSMAEHGTSSNNRYRGGDGSVTTNDLYSFGSILSSDRAIGSLGGSTVDTLYYGMQFTNDVGGDISLARISFKAEQWRSGDTGAAYIDSVQLFYSFTADSISDNSANANWTELPDLLMTSVVLDKYATALKGDTVFKVISAPVNMVVPAGSKLWLRWRDWNSRGADDGMGVDSLTVQFGTLRAIVTDKYPANNTTHIALPAPVRSIFDQPVQKSVGSLYIKNETDQTLQIISASSGNVVVNDTVVIVNGVNFLPVKTYHITFDTAAFVSLTGYTSFGIKDTSEWRFSTKVPTGIPTVTKGSIRMAALGTVQNGNMQLDYTVPQAGEINLLLTDMTGKEVYRSVFQSAAGHHVIQLNIDVLQSGLYIVRMNSFGLNGYTRCLVN